MTLKKIVLVSRVLMVLGAGWYTLSAYLDSTKAMSKSEVAVNKCDADLKQFEATIEGLGPKDARLLLDLEKELDEIDQILVAETKVFSSVHAHRFWVSEERKTGLKEQLQDMNARWNRAMDKIKARQKAAL